MTRPLYPKGKSPWYVLDRRLSGLQSRSGRGGEEKKIPSPAGDRARSLVSILKSRRTGHVVRMDEIRTACKILVGKPKWKIPLRRPRHTFEDNIKVCLTEVEFGLDLSRLGWCLVVFLWARRWTEQGILFPSIPAAVTSVSNGNPGAKLSEREADQLDPIPGSGYIFRFFVSFCCCLTDDFIGQNAGGSFVVRSWWQLLVRPERQAALRTPQQGESAIRWLGPRWLGTSVACNLTPRSSAIHTAQTHSPCS
jgi:hypothetical protein